jgi:hypothetical protein
MFEQTPEEMTADFFVDHEEAKLASEYGIPLHAGWQPVTYLAAVTLVRQTDALYPSIPAYRRKRFLALVGSLRNAFGPDFWQRYPSPAHLAESESKAFVPKTRWA